MNSEILFKFLSAKLEYSANKRLDTPVKKHFVDDYVIHIYNSPENDEFEEMSLESLSDMSVGLFPESYIMIDSVGEIKKLKDWRDLEEVENEEFIRTILEFFEDARFIIRNWTKRRDELMKGSLSADYPISYFNTNDLIEGSHVEFEHTSSIAMAIEIAADHLIEDKRYYLKIAVIEAKTPADFKKILIRIANILHEHDNHEQDDAITDMLEHSVYFDVKSMKHWLNDLIAIIEDEDNYRENNNGK